MAPREMTQAGMDDPPLAGIRVLDFGQYIAAPATAAVLGELGADVIKIEPLHGDQVRHIGEYGEAMLQAYSAGKRSIALDLRTPGGLEIAQTLVAHADVLVQNMRSGSMTSLGLGPEDCLRINPRLVYASVTGFGANGPSASRPGLDIAAQAESGMMSVTGETGGDPMRVGFAVVDAATADTLSQAVLAALLRRERTRRGAVVQTSLLEVAIRLQAVNCAEYFATGVVPMRRGNGQPSIAPAADVIRTKDGHIVLSAYTADHWARLCTLIERPDMIDDPRFSTNPARVRHREELLRILSDEFSSRTAEEAVDWLSHNGIIAGAVRTYDQVLKSEDVIAAHAFSLRGRTSVRQPHLPYTIDDVKNLRPANVPEIGEHTAEILAEIGYDDATVVQLSQSGAVGMRGTGLQKAN